MNVLFTILKGFSTGSGLIIAIGAQNAFVLRQGLKGRHLLLTAITCSIIDALLILFGVTGFGYYVSIYPLFVDITKYFASLFLFIYGLLALRSACKKTKLKATLSNSSEDSVKKILLTLLALSLLNPHTYLDTVILLGSIASQQPAHEQVFFAVRAISASFAWFFSITFGARLLAPFFQKEQSWRIIDGCIAVIMWGIALNVLF